jgi:hypothetical protein
MTYRQLAGQNNHTNTIPKPPASYPFAFIVMTPLHRVEIQ